MNVDSGLNLDLDPKWGELHRLHDPRILASFQARSTDVLITTGPKCGSTWMQQILHQLRTGGDERFEAIDEVVPWLEIQRKGLDAAQINEKFESLSNPRVFKTHCTYEQTPGVDTAKIILSSRDPRDACISFYHHKMNMTDEACEAFDIERPKNFDEFFDDWMAFGAWYRNIASWWPHINNDNLLWLRYEDMKVDLEQSIEQLLDFLAWKLSPQQKIKVMETCSFQWMKENSEKFTSRDENGNSTFKSKTFIRKGAVGDYKTLLSAKQAESILLRANETLTPECVKFLNLSI